MVDENIGDYREIGVFIVNKSMINVDIDPSQIEIYDMKGGKRKDFELVGADEYDKKIFKFKKKVAKRAVKNKAIVQTERENNVNANLGAQVFDAGTSNTLKDFQTRICRMQQLEDGNRMKYSDKCLRTWAIWSAPPSIRAKWFRAISIPPTARLPISSSR